MGARGSWGGMLRLLPLLALLGAAPPGERRLVARFGEWGVIRADAPLRCYAIARPSGERARRGGAFVAVASWPGEGRRGEVAVRIGRTRRPATMVFLEAGGRRFGLVARGAEAWAHDEGQAARIRRAMRGGDDLAIRYGGVEEHYPLAGAPTAIDAATLACADAGD